MTEENTVIDIEQVTTESTYQPKVSIVVCTYNRGDILKNCIDALFAQDYTNTEIIVVYTPSNDSTEEVLKEYDGKIIVCTNPVVNLSISRNIAIKNSTGEIIAFIDDDGTATPNWISELIKVYATGTEEEPVHAVGGRFITAPDELPYLCAGYISAESVLRKNPKIKNKIFLYGCNASYRKDVLVALGGFDEYLAFFYDDVDMSYRTSVAGYNVLRSDSAFIIHKRADSVNRANWTLDVRNRIYFMRHNTPYPYTDETVVYMAHIVRDQYQQIFRDLVKQKKMTPEEYDIAMQQTIAGMNEALADERQKERHLCKF